MEVGEMRVSKITVENITCRTRYESEGFSGENRLDYTLNK